MDQIVNDTPINVQVDPNEDTEWNDILRNHGILPPKPPSPTPFIEQAIVEARQEAHDNRLADLSLSDLDELEDDEDEAFLAQYRDRRMAQMKALEKKSRFGTVYPIQKVEYLKEVTEASRGGSATAAGEEEEEHGDNDASQSGTQSRSAAQSSSSSSSSSVPPPPPAVLVLLTSRSGRPESKRLEQVWSQAAPKFGDLKFCQIRADMCIEGYPDANTPTVLVYRNGDMVKQVVGLAELGGDRVGLRDLERFLVRMGIVDRKDSRVRGGDGDDGDEDDDDDDDGEDRDQDRGMGRIGARKGGLAFGKAARDVDSDDSWD